MGSRGKHPTRRALERFLVRCVAFPAYALVQRLSIAGARRLGNLVGSGIFLFTWRRQRLADANLRAVFGDRYSPAERRAIRLAVCRNLAKVFVELLKLPSLTPDQIRELVRLENGEVLTDALAAGKGAILITAHYGNWELLGARCIAEGVDMAVVARDASDASVAGIVNRCRESVNMRVLGRDDLRAMLEHLRAGKCLGILPDQHARSGSIRLSFLGRPAWVARGPAMLALRTGCRVVVGFCRRQPDDSLAAYAVKEIPVEAGGDRDAAVVAVMERINAALEEEIRQHPEQWLWLHDRWKTDVKRRTPTVDGEQ